MKVNADSMGVPTAVSSPTGSSEWWRSGSLRSWMLALFYGFTSGLAFSAAYGLRFEGAIPQEYQRQWVLVLPWVMVLRVVALMVVGQTRVLPTFFGLQDLVAVLRSLSLSEIPLIASLLLPEGRIPTGVLALDFVLVVAGITGGRVALRLSGDRRRAGGVVSSQRLPTAIVGAGATGAAVVADLLKSRGLRLQPVVFFDDNPAKWKRQLHGIPIVGPPELLAQAPWKIRVRRVVVTMPGAHASRIGEVVNLAAGLMMPVDILPGIAQLVEGRVHVSQLRPVKIEDLLRRDSITMTSGDLAPLVQGRVVAVTGAGGSIGSELCRQILRLGPSRLVMIDRSEVQLFPIEQELLALPGGEAVMPQVADVTDRQRIRNLFAEYRPALVFHAAAHKHVPMMEGQPGEAIRNNTLGTVNMATIAQEFGVERFVMISTDKAINPTNVMGATKRLAEIYLQAFQQAHPAPTRFMAVRFGNVLGSSGSVVPTFERQIAKGGPVTVTDPEVCRYFMTIPEAVGLVMEAAALGKGGEIFVLDMGEPVKIVDLARRMITLSGLRPDVDIEIRYTGLRPGEKLFEELSHHREQLTPTGHSMIFRFVCEPLPLTTVEDALRRLGALLNAESPGTVKQAMTELVPEYAPFRPKG